LANPTGIFGTCESAVSTFLGMGWRLVRITLVSSMT
jgi:hypothetical protein